MELDSQELEKRLEELLKEKDPDKLNEELKKLDPAELECFFEKKELMDSYFEFEESERLNFKELRPFVKELYFIKVTGTMEHGSSQCIEIASVKDVGRYDDNNGTLAFVDENGDYWVGRKTKESSNTLKMAGYSFGGIRVPHSNDGGQWMSENFDFRQESRPMDVVQRQVVDLLKKLESVLRSINKND